MPIEAPRSVRDDIHVHGQLLAHDIEPIMTGSPSYAQSSRNHLSDIGVESLNMSTATGSEDKAPTGAENSAGRRSDVDPSNSYASHQPTWPPPYLSEAKLADKKGWHLLNEYTYGAWGVAVAGREAIHITGWAKGDPKNFSIDSHLPASAEGSVVSGVFAVIEAIGTAHLAWKEKKKKSEIDKALIEHEQGHARFTAGDPALASLLGERQALTTLLALWPHGEEGRPIPEQHRDADSTVLEYEHARTDLEKINLKLEKLALDLAEDFEHYALYEEAANQSVESKDNVLSVGIAVARDCVIQLGGTACNAADSASKFGAHGVDTTATGVASGAFGIAMGALHLGAGAVGLYQAERRLDDLEAVRRQGASLRSVAGREQLVTAAAQAHLVWLDAEAAKTESDGVRHMHTERLAAAGSPEAAADAEMAKQIVEILTHHQDKGFAAIEAGELKKKSRAQTRMVYGAISIAMGIAFIIAGTIATGGLLPLILTAISLGLGVYWLISGFVRFFVDRSKAATAAIVDKKLMDNAKAILMQAHRPTVEQMRANRFVAINGMLMALLDDERPITRCALAAALRSQGMDANLLEALRLRSTIRLDTVYAKDKADIMKNLRCFTKAKKAALESDIAGAELRSDEAMLKALRQAFQEFIEGKTVMRQQYERRTGVLTYLREKSSAWVREKREQRPGLTQAKSGFGNYTAPAPVLGEVVQPMAPPVIANQAPASAPQPAAGVGMPVATN